MIIRSLTVLVAALLLTACAGSSSAESSSAESSSAESSSAGSSSAGSSSAEGLPDDAIVTYAFQDSSVPPQYHRSVTLTVDKSESRIVIDSYGDVLADETVDTPAATWNELGATIGTLDGLTVANAADGCTGGTAVDLRVTSGSQELVALSPEFCSGANERLEALIAAWIAPARGLFPATSELAPEGE